jgi:peptide/nickel transport system substrate-binding protein
VSVKRTVTGLLVLAAILSALASCAVSDTAVEPSPPEDVYPSATYTPVRSSDALFTARYNPDQSFNPLTGTSPENLALAPLLYEGLFVLNPQFIPEPVLCDSYWTQDGLTYTFIIKPDIVMSDGSVLTAADVKYSLNTARQSGRFASRLAGITNVTTTDDRTVVITLADVNRKLPALLDVPIIRSGSASSSRPAGTGPYILDTAGEPRLTAFSAYRDRDKLPVADIYLRACSDAEVPVTFYAQELDLFWSDPGGPVELSLPIDHDAWYYDTPILQYIGFNTNSLILSSPSIRRAIGLAVDRDAIAEAALGGHAVAAPLILSPKYRLYDTAWAKTTADPMDTIYDIFAEAGLEDFDNNGYLEYPGEYGVRTPFSLTFIVNADNPSKVAAASKIADSLMSVGLDITLSKLPWSDYIKALEKGDFDLYYGDVLLPADFDMSALLANGGALDYGHAGSDEYLALINAFLGASDDFTEKAAAQQLCAYVEQNAPVIPVLYRQYAVHTNRNVVTGARPTQSSIFYGLTGWTINLGPAS